MQAQLGAWRPHGKSYDRLTGSFTTCSMRKSYAMDMKMSVRTLFAAVLAPLALFGLGLPDASALGPKDEQDAARKAMLDGRVMPFAIIKRRVEREMGDATYLGSEFHEHSNRYRLKYVREGRVVWVDVDGRTGEIAGWAR